MIKTTWDANISEQAETSPLQSDEMKRSELLRHTIKYPCAVSPAEPGFTVTNVTLSANELSVDVAAAFHLTPGATLVDTECSPCQSLLCGRGHGEFLSEER